VELRTGAPYASLIAHHLQFGSAIAEYFGVEPARPSLLQVQLGRLKPLETMFFAAR
jgi:hypothetical protein